MAGAATPGTAVAYPALGCHRRAAKNRLTSTGTGAGSDLASEVPGWSPRLTDDSVRARQWVAADPGANESVCCPARSGGGAPRRRSGPAGRRRSRSSGSRGAVTASAPAPASWSCEVARREQVRGDDDPLRAGRAAPRPPRRAPAAAPPSRSRWSPGRPSARCSRSAVSLDVGHRRGGRWSPAAASTTAVSGSRGSAPACTQPVVQHLDQPRVRARADGRRPRPGAPATAPAMSTCTW